MVNQYAKAVAEVRSERNRRALVASSRSLGRKELEKLHTYVDLMRADWDRERRGLLPLMEDTQSDHVDSSVGLNYCHGGSQINAASDGEREILQPTSPLHEVVIPLPSSTGDDADANSSDGDINARTLSPTTSSTSLLSRRGASASTPVLLLSLIHI